ncbi:MAG TPA: P-loop NTPase [Candidatus Azoamicus sp. OHIO2]
MKIDKIIGIVSCKGGVGKSTLAVNLAVALSFFYKKTIGLLDADIYGPNHPSMLGLTDATADLIDKLLYPKKKFGISSMSMGYFLKKNSSVLLRGPMVSNTIKYLFEKTLWGNLDFLIIDFPPGTGDIHLSLLRDITFAGIFLVTTPQIASIEDIRRSISMLKKYNMNIYGILENMKYYYCTNCNFKNIINSNNIAFQTLISEFNITNIYSLPFDITIVNATNVCTPVIIYDADSVASNTFKNIAMQLIDSTEHKII